MGAQKVILAELQSQFGGSGAAYAKTFSGQLDLMGHELGTIGEEATMAVMPALQGMIEQLRLLIPEIGPKLKAAIESVDWKALTTAIVDVTTFFIENIETIGKVVAAIFILNTAFKLMAVASGIAKVAIALQTWFTAQLATGMTLATVAANILRVAMLLLPWALAAVGIALVVTGIMELGDETKRNKPYVDNYGGAIRKTGEDALWAAGRYGIATDAVNTYNAAISGQKITTSAAYDRAEEIRFRNMAAYSKSTAASRASVFPTMPDFSSLLGGGGGSSQAAEISDSLNQLIASQQQAANQEQGILDKRLSAFEAFNNAIKGLFGQIKDSILSSFNLPTLGNSVNSITRNISKLLERTKSFAKNISQLSGMGLNSALLQQVIQAGPMAGSQLAAAIVGGGSSFVGQLNQAFGEMGMLASGIAGAGVTSAFNTPTVENTYNIEVNGGVGSGPSIGKAIVDAIKSYERTSGAVWQGA
jgi:hypothetical protein